MRNQERNTDGLRVKQVLLGLGVCLAAAIICLAILAALTLNERIGESLAESIMYVILTLSAFLGSWIAARQSDKMQSIPAVAVSAIYGCILLVLGLLLFDGKMVSPVMKMAAIGAGCIIASMITGRGKQTRSKRKKRYR